MTIGILETGRSPVALRVQWGTYGDMIRTMLGRDRKYRSYDVQAGELPADPAECSAYVIAGSPAGVYDHLPWVPLFLDLLCKSRGRAKLVGIGFGHQMMAKAFGGEVAKSPKGWAVGMHRYEIVEPPPGMREPLAFAIPAFHQDQVVTIPPGARALAASEFTPFAVTGYDDDRIASPGMLPSAEPLPHLKCSRPGFMEADLVAHSGPTAEGSFVQTLTLTDIATGWTECAPLLVREQTLLTEVLGEVRKRLPFPLLGFDTDNDSVFMNETVRDYCAAAGNEFTRCRPYRKNDQAWVEQKNGAVVRRIAGYRRYVGLEVAATLGRLYGSVRLFVNFFQPSFKLAGKMREGAKVTKRYHAPATPYQRLMADPRTGDEMRRRASALHATLDPVRLLSEIRLAQRQLVEIADRPVTDEAAAPSAPTLAQFLLGLRTSWQEGEVRPTARPKKRAAPYCRHVPDPFEAVAVQVRGWFEAEPWRTARELLKRVQGEHPGVYPDGQLRTLQRRLRIWRREVAHALVFGPPVAGEQGPALPSVPLQSVT